MSLLDTAQVWITVYPEEMVIDIDGNTRTQAAKTGIRTKARLQVLGQSGTSARRQEQDNEGYETEKVYTMRFPRSFPIILGAQSQIEWMGHRWVVFGDVNYYLNSRRTKHVTYTIKRF
jgi:hypothetical protein